MLKLVTLPRRSLRDLYEADLALIRPDQIVAPARQRVSRPGLIGARPCPQARRCTARATARVWQADLSFRGHIQPAAASNNNKRNNNKQHNGGGKRDDRGTRKTTTNMPPPPAASDDEEAADAF